jgi:glycerophosphoryl diester phosphodiesterase
MHRPVLEVYNLLNLTTGRKLIVAHRGDRSRAHENTLAAFQLAIVAGADMIELDVRRTGDGELVVHHDEEIDGLLLAESNYQEVLRRSVPMGFNIPLFAEVLETTSGRISLDVELKEAGYEPRVISMIFDHRFRVQDFVLTSFDSDAMTHVKEEYPGIRTALLLENMSGESMMRRFHEIEPDYLAPEHTALDERTLAEAARSNIPIFAWTVNDDVRIHQLLRAQAVAGIVTDRPMPALRLRSASERR